MPQNFKIETFYLCAAIISFRNTHTRGHNIFAECRFSSRFSRARSAYLAAQPITSACHAASTPRHFITLLAGRAHVDYQCRLPAPLKMHTIAQCQPLPRADMRLRFFQPSFSSQMAAISPPRIIGIILRALRCGFLFHTFIDSMACAMQFQLDRFRRFALRAVYIRTMPARQRRRPARHRVRAAFASSTHGLRALMR